MPIPTFPHADLSADCSMTHKQGAEYEDPSIVVTFESGWEDVRPIRSVGRFRRILVHVVAPATDANIILDFLKARRLQAEKFYYVHPTLGTGLVRYASDSLPHTHPVIGGPDGVVWYEFDLELRGQY